MVRALAELLAKANYSRSEVRTALRTVTRSVNRHTKQGGPDGYLTFIQGFLKPKR